MQDNQAQFDTNRDLHAAIYRGDAEGVKKAINRGADVNAVLEDMSALQIAASEGYSEIVATLIAQGAQVNFQYQGGYAALHTAAEEGQATIVAMLLKNGADVNRRNSHNGETVLHLAALSDDDETIKAIIAKGQTMPGWDINAKDSLGRSAVDFAMLHNKPNTMRILIQSGASFPDNALAWATSHELDRVVRALLDKGAAVDQTALDTADQYSPPK